MWNYVKGRAKAFAALAVPGIALALIKAFEGAAGVDVPAEYELYLLGFVATALGWIGVEGVPNLPPTLKS